MQFLLIQMQIHPHGVSHSTHSIFHNCSVLYHMSQLSRYFTMSLGTVLCTNLPCNKIYCLIILRF